MTRFIKVADKDSSCDFIDLEKVTKVSCSVKRTKTGSGFNIESIVDESFPKTSPVVESTKYTIVLSTAGGTGEVHFSELDEAKRWAKNHLGLDVPFDQF